MTTVATLSKPPSQEELAPYRAISRSAVVSVALTLISLPLVVMAMVAAFSGFGDSLQVGLVGGALAIPALILGWSGWRAVGRFPTEYTGGRLARFGLLGGLVLMIAGFSVSAISYA